MRTAMLGWMVVALVLVGLSIGWASDRDEAILKVEVSSAEHEAEEGYFALGTHATIMAKPGSVLHRFLSRHRGRTVRIVLSPDDSRELSRLQRD